MTNTTDTWKQNADRAMELFERKSPEQLAVELVQMQDKHAQAMAALDRMQDQRDQLAAQLKDATRQCGVMADLLRELREGAEIHLHNCTVCNNEEGIANWTGKLERIDALLAGKLPEHDDDLTADEISLLSWVCLHPGCKNEDVAWGNEKDGTSEPLWKKLEQLGMIEVVGSYKWAATDKGRTRLSLTIKTEGVVC